MITYHTGSMLMTGMSAIEFDEMQRVAEDIVLRGSVPHHWPVWMIRWFEFNEFDQWQSLIISTVFPQRVLMSLLHAYDSLPKDIEPVV